MTSLLGKAAKTEVSSTSTSAGSGCGVSSGPTESPPSETSPRPDFDRILAAVRSGDSDTVSAWRLLAETKRERIHSTVSMCMQLSACESATALLPLPEAKRLHNMSAADASVVMSCTWPQARVVMRTRHEGAAAIVLDQRRLGLLSLDDFVLLSPSAGFRGGYDSVGERHDVLGVDSSRPTVGDVIGSSNALQLSNWERSAVQHRARVSELLDCFLELWSSRFHAAVITVQLLPSEAEALSALPDEALRARCLRCLWPLLRISVPKTHAAQLAAAKTLVETSGIPATDADVVVDAVVQLGGPGFLLAGTDVLGLSTVGACMTAQTTPHPLLSCGHGCECGQPAELHDPCAWTPWCPTSVECIAYMDPSRGESGPVSFIDAPFIATWIDLTLSPRRFVTVADVGVYSAASPPTSAVGLHYAQHGDPHVQPVLWGAKGRHYGISSHDIAGSYRTQDLFEFYITGTAYRLAGYGEGSKEPIIFSSAQMISLGGTHRTAEYPSNSEESSPLIGSPLVASIAMAQDYTAPGFDAGGSVVEVMYHVTMSCDAAPSAVWALPGDSGATATHGTDDEEALLGIVKGRFVAAPREGLVTPSSLAVTQVRSSLL